MNRLLNYASYVFLAVIVAAMLYVFGRGVGESVQAQGRPFDVYETPTACVYVLHVNGAPNGIAAVPRNGAHYGC